MTQLMCQRTERIIAAGKVGQDIRVRVISSPGIGTGALILGRIEVDPSLFKSLIDDRNIVITQHMKCFFQNVTAFLDRIVHITGRFHIQRNIIFMEVLDAEHLFFQCKVFVKICNVFFVGHDQNFVIECFINTVLKQTGLQSTVKMAGLGIEDLSFGIADQQIGKGIFHISVLFEIMLKCLSSHVHIFIAQKFMISCTV